MSGGLCLVAAVGAVLATIPGDRFTLAWEHSVEKIRWEEDYELREGRIVPVVARVRGSGAGMEIPEGAIRRAGGWEYRVNLPPLERLRLAASPHGGDYELCIEGRCRRLRALVPGDAPVDLVACP
jgi:hypothetical protein